MKTPDYLILASTETGEGKTLSKADVIDQHTRPAALGGLGFNRPGFDYLVLPDGTLETLLPEEHPNTTDLWGISEGADGLNGMAKVLAYVGGMTEKATKEKDTRTEQQQATLAAVVHFYVKRFPRLRVLGWDEVPAKVGSKNPAFPVQEWLTAIGVPDQHRFQDTKTPKKEEA